MRRLIALIEKNLTWLQLITGGGLITAVGWVSHWTAKQTGWIVAYGPYAIWLATLVGMLIVTVALVAIAWFRYVWSKGVAINRWQEMADRINPLDREFHTKRISIAELAHPFSGRISNKRLIDCEILGPGNIAFLNNTLVTGVDFVDCDFVVVDPTKPIRNVSALENFEMFGGKLWRCTIFIPPEMIEQFRNAGAHFITELEAARVA